MAKGSKIAIKDILKGKFLVDQGSSKHWKFIFFLLFLGFLMIYSSHLVNQKIDNINDLKKEVGQLKSQYANIHEALTTQESSTNIEALALKDSILHSNTQPYFLIDTIK